MQTPTDELIALICKALTERYPLDSTRPGVVISHLASNGDDTSASFYVSVVRYLSKYPGGPRDKEVLVHTYQPTLDEAVLAVAQTLAVATPKVTAQRALERAIGGSK